MVPSNAPIADILPLLPPEAAKPEGPSHRRIRAASRVLAALFSVLLAADALFVLGLMLAFFIPALGRHVGIGPVGMLLSFGVELPHPYVAVHTLSLIRRLAHVAMGVLALSPALLIFWNLRRLFGLYGQGRVFARENAVHIKWIGVWLAADALAPFVVHLALNALHLAIDQHWMHLYSLQELVLGGVVYVIALVMEQGHAIEEEQGQFV